MHKLKVLRDYEDGRVSEERSDAISTSDLCAKINDGLSEAFKADVHLYEMRESL